MQTVPPVYANGNLYNPPFPLRGSPGPVGHAPPSMLPIVPPGPPIYHDPGPGPYPWPGNGHGVPNPYGSGSVPPMPGSMLSGRYPSHDFYLPYDPRRTPQQLQMQALMNLLAKLGG